MIKSKRLQKICNYIEKENNIIDIGCDHAYVSIEMKKKGLKKVLATDIHPNALEIAQKNILESKLEIDTQLSDGLKEIDMTNYDTIIISGMGESTIEHILKEKEKLKNIKKLIIQSNNELPKLREYIETIGFFIEDETIVFEANHFYTIMLCKKGNKKLTKQELEFGIYKKENLEYYKYQKEKFRNLSQKVPNSKKETFLKKIQSLDNYLKERKQDY